MSENKINKYIGEQSRVRSRIKVWEDKNERRAEKEKKKWKTIRERIQFIVDNEELEKESSNNIDGESKDEVEEKVEREYEEELQGRKGGQKWKRGLR